MQSVALAGNKTVASEDSPVSTVRAAHPDKTRAAPSLKVLDEEDVGGEGDSKGNAKTKSDDDKSGHVSTGGAVVPPPALQKALREDLTGMDLDSIVQLDSVYNKELR